MRAIFAVVLSAALFAASIAPAPAQERKLPLIDEGASDISWLRFKKQLMAAVEKRDKQFLLSILDKNVRNQDERARGIARTTTSSRSSAPGSPSRRCSSRWTR